MIIHVEYQNLPHFKNVFWVFSKKYGVKLSGFCLHFDKAVWLAPYRFLRKKVGQIRYQLPIKLLNGKLVSLCNRLSLDLAILIDKPLTKAQMALLNKLDRAIVVYNSCQDEQTKSFLLQQSNLLICSSDQDCALQADLFHLAVYQQHQYQCKCTSCLSNILYVNKQNQVSFCPFHPQESMLCDLSFEGDFFDNDLFIQVLTEQIEKRNECKQSCDYYSICHGGCAMKDVCQTVKSTYPIMQQRAKEIDTQQIPLSELAVYEKEGILRGVSQGK